MTSLIGIFLCLLPLTTLSKEAAKVRLFSEMELEEVKLLSSPQFINKKRRDAIQKRSEHFFAYALSQSRKAADKRYNKEVKEGASKLLGRYSPSYDLDYLIKKELLKEIKRNER